MNEKQQISASIDKRGFIRISKKQLKLFSLEKKVFANLYTDIKSKCFALEFTDKLSENAFRILHAPASILIYIKSAIQLLKLSELSGKVSLTKENQKFIFSAEENKGIFNWDICKCRNSAGIPMISINSRGTLIFDKKITEILNTKINNAFTPEYDPKKKEWILKFHKDGFINVRTIASHAEASFMGSLSGFGFSLPQKLVRISCSIEKNILIFKANKLLLKG